MEKAAIALAITANHGAAKWVSLTAGFNSKMTFNTLVNFSISTSLLIDSKRPTNAENAEETMY